MGQKNEGEDPPNLSLKNIGTVKKQNAGEGDLAHAEGVDQPNGGIGNSNIEHQVGDPKVGMLPAKTINLIFYPGQSKNLPRNFC